MEISNIKLGSNVNIDTTTSINNVKIEDGVRIAKYCSVYGSETNQLEIGCGSYIGMFSILNGYAGKLKVGAHVSIAQNVNIMTDSGPNASTFMQKYYPILTGDVTIEDHAWVGAGVVIMPNVIIGRCSIIAANSFVNSNVEPFSLYAGNPAKFIKTLDPIKNNDSQAI